MLENCTWVERGSDRWELVVVMVGNIQLVMAASEYRRLSQGGARTFFLANRLTAQGLLYDIYRASRCAIDDVRGRIIYFPGFCESLLAGGCLNPALTL